MTELSSDLVYLGPDDVPKYLENEWLKLVAAVKNALKAYSAGKVIQPIRAAVTVKEYDGVLFAMPAYNAEESAMVPKLSQYFLKMQKKRLQLFILLCY